MTTEIEILLGNWQSLAGLAQPIRQKVFVQEQGIPADLEYDELDTFSLHAVARIKGEPVGTGRLLPNAYIGRMAVLAPHRRSGVGARLLGELVRAAIQRGDPQVELSAQAYVRRFYEAHGFAAEGETYYEAGILHVHMTRALPNSVLRV